MTANKPTANELAGKLEVIAEAMRERKFAGHAFYTPWRLRGRITDSAALLRTQAAEIESLEECVTDSRALLNRLREHSGLSWCEELDLHNALARLDAIRGEAQ